MNTERLLQGFKDDIAADVHCAVRRFKMTLIVNQVKLIQQLELVQSVTEPEHCPLLVFV